MRLVAPRTYRWSRDEFHQMADLGWFDDKHVELIDGEIIEMPIAKEPHVKAVSLALRALTAAFGLGHWIRPQAGLDLDPHSEPEPDLAVVPGDIRDSDARPSAALLVVEVSETTLHLDRNRKGSLYARSSIADYWIVNLVDRQLEVYRNPVADSSAPSGFRYADVTILRPGDFVSPLAAPTARVAVADLLP
jgi:Uma2 family endonuclease